MTTFEQRVLARAKTLMHTERVLRSRHQRGYVSPKGLAQGLATAEQNFMASVADLRQQLEQTKA